MTATVVDVVTPVPTLLSGHVLSDPEGITIFNDLNSGAVFGGLTIIPTDVDSILEATLSAAALSEINAGGGFAVGLFRSSSGSTIIPAGVRFSGLPPGILDEFNIPTQPRLAQLVLTQAESEPDPNPFHIPEPSSMFLFIMGPAGLGLVKRR